MENPSEDIRSEVQKIIEDIPNINLESEFIQKDDVIPSIPPFENQNTLLDKGYTVDDVRRFGMKVNNLTQRSLFALSFGCILLNSKSIIESAVGSPPLDPRNQNVQRALFNLFSAEGATVQDAASGALMYANLGHNMYKIGDNYYTLYQILINLVNQNAHFLLAVPIKSVLSVCYIFYRSVESSGNIAVYLAQALEVIAGPEHMGTSLKNLFITHTQQFGSLSVENMFFGFLLFCLFIQPPVLYGLTGAVKYAVKNSISTGDFVLQKTACFLFSGLLTHASMEHILGTNLQGDESLALSRTSSVSSDFSELSDLSSVSVASDQSEIITKICVELYKEFENQLRVEDVEISPKDKSELSEDNKTVDSLLATSFKRIESFIFSGGLSRESSLSSQRSLSSQGSDSSNSSVESKIAAKYLSFNPEIITENSYSDLPEQSELIQEINTKIEAFYNNPAIGPVMSDYPSLTPGQNLGFKNVDYFPTKRKKYLGLGGNRYQLIKKEGKPYGGKITKRRKHKKNKTKNRKRNKKSRYSKKK